MAAGDTYDAVGGTITLPISTIKVTGGACEKSLLRLENITGPGDSGNVVFHPGNVRYGFSLRGVYVEGGQAADTLDDAIEGSGTISLGNGEEWSGDVIIQRIRSSSDWGPGGSVGVVLSGVFTGSVAIAQPS